MTDPQPTHDPFDVESWTEKADKPRPASRRWLHLLGTAAGALVLGAVASTTVMLVAGWRYVPEREFTVAVSMEPDADLRQRDAVEQALGALPARDGIRLETREQAYQKLRERAGNDPVQLEGVTAESMPESLSLTTVGRDFECGPLPAVRKMAGVDRVRVVMRPGAGRPGAELVC
ncbi:permease-like cell division protein FtsX [Actinoplanes sp. NPDC023801]|uniref:permease-like cell division protein FtsX n=1 Tax=Actinoplanes sp. NPDC023801 TaxID=3154595 RepID=UPI0033F3FEB6